MEFVIKNLLAYKVYKENSMQHVEDWMMLRYTIHRVRSHHELVADAARNFNLYVPYKDGIKADPRLFSLARKAIERVCHEMS